MEISSFKVIPKLRLIWEAIRQIDPVKLPPCCTSIKKALVPFLLCYETRTNSFVFSLSDLRRRYSKSWPHILGIEEPTRTHHLNLKVCGVDSAIAQNRYLFHVFKLFYGVAKHAAAVQYEKLMSPWAPSARIFISKEDADSITDLVRLRSILRIAAS